jgi:hypothetical protein
MKTYLIVLFDNERAAPSKVVRRLCATRFELVKGFYDRVYDWKKKVAIDDLPQLSDPIHQTVKGLRVTYKLETA